VRGTPYDASKRGASRPARWHEACANLIAVIPREDVMPVMLILLVLQALEGLNPLTVPQFARVRVGDGGDAVAVIERTQVP